MRLDEVRLGSRTLQPGRQLLVGGRREPIGKRALDILSVLAEAKGEIVTKDELLEAVWPGVSVEENALQVHVVALRKALGPEAGRLRTIRGIGYQLETEANGSGIPAQPPATAADPAPADPTIVVLPFENMVADPEQDYFADGITEDIITDLSQVSALKVIARNSAFAFKGKHVDVRDVARQLKASHVLQGSVRRSDRRLRVSVQLIDGRTNDHVWAQRFDRDLADIFDLQDELTEAIVRALKVSLLPSERMEIAARDTTSAEAYDLYVRARALRSNMQLDSIPKSLEAYRQALEIDPGFAMAWAGLASSLIQNLTHFPECGIELREIDHAINRATELSPGLPNIIAAKAQRCLLVRDWEGAEECVAAFRQLGDESWSVLSFLLLTLGRASEAADHQLKVSQADPFSPGANWAAQFHLDCAGRLDEAELAFERSRELAPMHTSTNWPAIMRAMARQDHARVRDCFRAWCADDTHQFPYFAELTEVLDDPAAALGVIRRAFSDPKRQQQLALDSVAHWATFLGDDALALAALRKSTVELPGLMLMGIWHPNFASLRRQPGFRDILIRLGLVAYWRKSGNWGEFVRPVGEDDFEVIA